MNQGTKMKEKIGKAFISLKITSSWLNQRSNHQHLLDHRKSKGIPGGEGEDSFCFIDCAKVFDCVDHHKQIFQTWKILKEMGIPDHLTCLLRNLYAAQEAIVRTRYGLVQNQERSTSRLYIVLI